ncbi:hypothetical protein [Pedobacter cryoconitis]|uniref:hypothetical protein n=1 Tax=Pedobacter cryoconitis TaxID=188932 RepID=UPI00160919A6|nr:hypothetical protein [Pedobacter cryoconitis]MBB5643763.1 hypothetical protein [Pedobacter cryoconitis]
MDKESLLKIINSDFPGNTGILLTGSQHNNQTFTITSDIDVIVIEPLFSNVTSRGFITDDNFVIDIIIFPLFNIDEILDNECFDSRGSLLSMLAKAKILNDPLDILPTIILKANKLFGNLRGKTPLVIEQKLKELLRIRKHLDSQLSDYQKMFLTSDLISHVSTLEAIRSTNWDPTRRHKADILVSNNQLLTKQLYGIFTSTVFGIQNNDIIEFIDNYYKTYLIDFNEDILKHSLVCLDLDLGTINPVIFYTSILPEIIRIEGDKFLYSYFSIKKYQKKYKNNITLCFDLDTRDNVIALLQRLLKLINGEYHIRFNYELFLEKRNNNSIKHNLSILLSQNIVNAFTRNKQLEKPYYIHIFYFICGFISNHFGLSIKDSIKIHEAISQKWVTNKKEQEENNETKDLLVLQKKKNIFGNNFYKEHQQIIDLLITQGALASEKSDYKNNPFELEKVLVFIKDQYFEEKESEDQLLLKIIIEKLEFNSPKNAFLYNSYIDIILQMIPFTDEEKWLVNTAMKAHFIQY